MTQNPSAPDPTLLLARVAVSSFFMLHGFFAATWISRIPAEAERLHLSAAVLGLVLLGNTTGALLAGLTSGGIVGSLGSRRVVRGAAILSSLALVCLGLMTQPSALFVGLAVFGFSVGNLNIAMNAQAAALEARYGKPIFSSFHALWSLGALLGALAGSGLAGLGLVPLGHFAMVGLLGIVLAWQIGQRLLASSGTPGRAVFVLPRGSLLMIGLMGFCAAISDSSISGWSGVYLRSLHAPESVAALGFAVYQSVMLLGRSSGDWLVGRFGAVATVRYSALLGGLGLVLAVATGTLWGIFVGIACMGWGLANTFPLMFASAARTEGMSPASAMASASTMSTLGGLSGPVLLGAVAELATVRASYAVAALLTFAVSYLAVALANYRTRG